MDGNVTPKLLIPTPTVKIPDGYNLTGKPAKINPDFLSKLLDATALCYSEENNKYLIPQNAQGTNLWELYYFFSVPVGPAPSAEEQQLDAAGNPPGSLYTLASPTGPSAYTPPPPAPNPVFDVGPQWPGFKGIWTAPSTDSNPVGTIKTIDAVTTFPAGGIVPAGTKLAKIQVYMGQAWEAI